MMVQSWPMPTLAATMCCRSPLPHRPGPASNSTTIARHDETIQPHDPKRHSRHQSMKATAGAHKCDKR
ncbi:hypothetical protein BC831DRAFT_128354 [Entophlyctis helioformis]|nr:hypothetical protein BC831DRAFT_128354 [Entophlyctis helioformis]